METRSAWPLRDDGGYVVGDRDLAFLMLSTQDLQAMTDRRRPLGTSDKSFEYFLTSLCAALTGSNVSSCDVRLQGSSASFFSGIHKSIPWTREDIYESFVAVQERVPRAFEIDRVATNLQALWSDAEKRPTRRMFDLMKRLGIDLQRSDIDVQLSSDDLYYPAADRIEQAKVAATPSRVSSDSYGFVRKYLIKGIAPALTFWADEQSAILDRLVAVAVFPASGPPEVPHATLSSHFRDSDWKLDLELPGQDG